MSGRLVERLAAVLAFGCWAAFGAQSFLPRRAGPAPVAPRPISLLGAMATIGTFHPGERRTVAVPLANPSVLPRRILGVAKMCGRHVCYEDLVEPVLIPPQSFRPVAIMIKATSVGEIHDRVTFYTDQPGAGDWPVALTGQVVAEPTTP